MPYFMVNSISSSVKKKTKTRGPLGPSLTRATMDLYGYSKDIAPYGPSVENQKKRIPLTKLYLNFTPIFLHLIFEIVPL